MLGIALYGDNGHQIQNLIPNYPDLRLIGTAAMKNPPPGVKQYADLQELLADRAVGMVSLCSPVRAEQAGHAILCLRAGKHVYAEKPCALAEADLDRILQTAESTGMSFHEMAGTAFEEPYATMGEIVAAGEIGTVVQVFAQKSYPYHDGRPQDEAVDGGLIRQSAVHALRMIEQAAHQSIIHISATETCLGNPVYQSRLKWSPSVAQNAKRPQAFCIAPTAAFNQGLVFHGGLRMAANLTMTLKNGGLALVAANYLNQPGHGEWGNEHLRIFGDKGFVEATDGGRRTRLVVGKEDRGALALRPDRPGYLQYILDDLLGRVKMPLTIEQELHPTRMAIRAKEEASLWS